MEEENTMIYRQSVVGEALQVALKSLEESRVLPKDMCLRTLDVFDRSMNENLNKLDNKIKLNGNCTEFKTIGEVHSFILKNVSVEDLEGGMINSNDQVFTEGEDNKTDRMKLVIIESKDKADPKKSGGKRKKRGRKRK